MKPTPELINDWHEKARQMAIQADGYFDDVEHWRRFAELAAQWGAEQAQQTTEETDAEMALRSIASWLGVGGFNAPTVDAKAFERKIYEGVEMAIKSHCAIAEEPELPEAVGYMNAGHVHELTQRRISYGYVYPKKETGASVAVYTATQMHDHFAAKAREAMAQQWRTIDSAPKDGTDILVLADSFQYVVSFDRHFDQWDGPYRLRASAPTHWTPLPAPPKEQQ